MFPFRIECRRTSEQYTFEGFLISFLTAYFSCNFCSVKNFHIMKQEIFQLKSFQIKIYNLKTYFWKIKYFIRTLTQFLKRDTRPRAYHHFTLTQHSQLAQHRIIAFLSSVPRTNHHPEVYRQARKSFRRKTSFRRPLSPKLELSSKSLRGYYLIYYFPTTSCTTFELSLISTTQKIEPCKFWS